MTSASQPSSNSSTPTSTPAPAPASAPETSFTYISRAKRSIYSTLAHRRPWRQLLNYSSLSRPTSPYTIFSRLKTNLSYFRLNYAIVILLCLFLSLLYEPASLIVFLVMMVAWVFFFFLRDEPLVIFGRIIDDPIVLTVLSAFTIGFLLFAGATVNLVVSLAVGFGIVVVYSVFRQTDDLFLDEEEAIGAGLLADRDGAGPGR